MVKIEERFKLSLVYLGWYSKITYAYKNLFEKLKTMGEIGTFGKMSKNNFTNIFLRIKYAIFDIIFPLCFKVGN